MKRCCRCKAEKPTSEFYRDKSRKDGLKPQCRDCKRELDSAWAKSESGRESARARQRRFAEANPDRVSEWTRAWRAANPDYSAEANRRWREANPGAAAAYHQANREKTIERVNRRRQRIKSGASTGPVDLDALWSSQAGVCGICNDEIDRSVRYPGSMSPSVDHIVPLAKGGTHEQSNLQWTHLVCNIRKGAKVPASSTPLQGDQP